MLPADLLRLQFREFGSKGLLGVVCSGMDGEGSGLDNIAASGK